jgi:hypothetical protein
MSWQDLIAMAVVLWAAIYVLARLRRRGSPRGLAASVACKGCRCGDAPSSISIDPLPQANGDPPRSPPCGGHDGVGR